MRQDKEGLNMLTDKLKSENSIFERNNNEKDNAIKEKDNLIKKLIHE